MTDTVDKVIIQSSSEGTDQATNELQGLAKAYDGVTVASQNTERSTTSVESKFASLERRSGTTAGQLAQFEKIQRDVNLAVAQNPTLVDRGNAVLAAAEQRYGGVSQALQKQRNELAQVAAVQKTVDATTGVVGLSDSSARAADIQNYGKQLDSLRAKYNPLFAAGQQYKATLTDINQAVKAGALTEAEGAAAIMNTKVAFVEQVNSIRGVTEAEAAFAQGSKVAKAATDELSASHTILSNQAQTLAHAARGSVEQFLMGVPTTRILASEFSHLSYASTGPGGLSGAFNELTGFFGKMITPAVAVTAGVVGIAGAALYLGNSWQEAQSKVNQALIGIGERTGTTAADINKFANANSTATGLSIADSRELGIELTKTGNVAVGSLTGVGQAVHGYSVLTGKDATEATKDFASALSGDLVEGIKKLDAPFGSLNADTIEHIRNLDLQSAGALDTAAKTQALQIWLDGIASTSKKAADSVGFLTSAYRGLSNALSAIKNGTGDIRTPQQQLDQAKEKLGAAQNPGFSDQLAGGFGSLNGADTLPDFKKLEDDVKTAQKTVDGLDSTKAAAQLRALSEASDSVVHSVLPQIDAIHGLDKAISTLQLAQEKGVAAKGSDNALTVLQYQRDLQQDSLDKTIQQATVVGQLQEKYGDVSAQTAITLNNLQGQLSVASQRTAQGQIQAQEQAQINDLLAQGTSAEEAASIAAAQRAVSEEKVYQSMQKAVDASNDQVKLYATQGSAEQASVKAAIAYRQAIEAGADSTQAGIIATNTATVATAQWAEQAQKVAEAYENAQRAAHDAQFSDPGGSFGNFTLKGTEHTSTSPVGFAIQQLYDMTGSTQSLIDGAAAGGVDAALSRLKNAGVSTGPGAVNGIIPAGATWEQYGLASKGSQSDIDSAVSQLFTIKETQAGNDNNAKLGVYNDELAYYEGKPQTLATLQKIADLKNSIDNLKNATDANTAATNATLNPLYSGRGALQIGYYKAASGLDVIAQGPTSGDQVPFHAMVNGGERIRIMTAAEQASSTSSNDNRRNTTINISMTGGLTSSARRVQRQLAQGFGQTLAAVGG